MKEKLKQTFLDLIALNGVHPHEQPVIDYVLKRLGVKNIAFQQDAFGNIVAQIYGIGEPLVISTHLDIPEDAPNVQYHIEGDIIRSDGTSILGADPKSGLAVILDFLDTIVEQPSKSHVPIEIVLTRAEETGLQGALNLDYSLIQARAGVVLDWDGPVTEVAVESPACVLAEIRLNGKTAHSTEPHQGVNALQAACETLMYVPCGYIEEGITWNVGIFQAGTARNSIPGNAFFTGELRGFNTENVVKAAERIEQVCHKISKKYGAICEFTSELKFRAHRLERTDPLFKRLERTYHALGLKPNYVSSHGGSDAMVFNDKGIVSVPIGAGYYNAHQYDEYARLDDMENIHRFLVTLVSRDRV